MSSRSNIKNILIMTNYKIKVYSISKIFFDKLSPEGLHVLYNISFDVKVNELFCILGPSGCGKTTLLNIISGLIKPTEGKIFFKSEATSEKNNLGFVFQQDLLLPWRNAWKNVLIGLEVQNKLTEEKKNEAKKYWEEYKLKGFENYYPKSLSGGMRQKISLIRTLLCDPDVILLDEPFANIDYEMKLELEENVINIAKNEDKTIIFVTHDIEEAISIADRIIVLSHLPARIVGDYKINLSISSRNPVAARKAPEFKDYFTKIWDNFKSD